MLMQTMLQTSGSFILDKLRMRNKDRVFSGKQKRSYRNSLEVVKKAATVWKENGVEFVAQLGDIIDSRAKKHNGSQMECEKVSVDRFEKDSSKHKRVAKVLRELNKSGCNHLVNIIGNHELYNFSREELDKRLGVRMSGATWYSYKPWSSIPLRFKTRVKLRFLVKCHDYLIIGWLFWMDTISHALKVFLLRKQTRQKNTC